MLRSVCPFGAGPIGSAHVQGQYDEADGFQELNKKLAEKEEQHEGPVGRLFYLSIPPSAYAGVMKMIKKHCSDIRGSSGNGAEDGGSKCEQAAKENSWVRVVIEKPFGCAQAGRLFALTKLRCASCLSFSSVMLQLPCKATPCLAPCAFTAPSNCRRDLETSEELADQIAELFQESQIFRADHFLCDESVEARTLLH